MKYKALLLSLLVLSATLVIFAPKASATIEGPVIWVNPSESKFWAPCQISKTFEVQVKLWNKKDLTGVGIYAYDFSIAWFNSTYLMTCAGVPIATMGKSMISLVGVTITSPFEHYFIVANETIHHNLTPGYDEYHLAITALDASTPLEDVQVSLVTLTFHIDSEPCYPDTWTNIFNLYNVQMSNIKAEPITLIEIVDGTYTIGSSQPDAHLKPDGTTLPINPETGLPYIMDYKVGDEYTFDVYLSNMTNVYGFEFWVSYNPLYLLASAQCVSFSALFPPPYTYLAIDVDPGQGTLHVKLLRPLPPVKPLISCAVDAKVATFCLTTTAPEFKYAPELLNEKMNTTITLNWAYQYSRCCSTNIVYTPWDLTYTLRMLNTTIQYMWRPNLVDLNLDGVVDIADLSALAKVYGEDNTVTGWAALAPATNIVDIYDFVMVAKKFGKTYIPELTN